MNEVIFVSDNTESDTKSCLQRKIDFINLKFQNDILYAAFTFASFIEHS